MDVKTMTDDELRDHCRSLAGTNEDATAALQEYLNRKGHVPLFGTYKVTTTITFPPTLLIKP